MGLIVKICGLSTAETLEAALAAGADMVGLVLFERSPRAVSLEAAAALARRVAGRAEVVALTVDLDDAGLAAVVETVAPDWLQLHGAETPERVAAVRARFGRPVLKAVGIAAAADLAAARAHAETADALLLDAKPPAGAGRPGGHGAVFDWSVARGFSSDVPWLLSGGLRPGNVGEAIAATGASGVDVSSGVETAPGVKSPELIRAFVAAARRAATMPRERVVS
jgi:phosphoribosylanthranilate isomerase